MHKFKLIDNGYVSESLDYAWGDVLSQLKQLRIERAESFELAINGVEAVETIRLGKKLIGHSFKAFVEANYNNGASRLSGLMINVVQFLNGKIPAESVVTAITIEENRFKFADEDAPSSNYAVTVLKEPLLGQGDSLHDLDLYRLMAGITPGHFGRLLLLLGGVGFYVQPQ